MAAIELTAAEVQALRDWSNRTGIGRSHPQYPDLKTAQRKLERAGAKKPR